MKHKSIIKALSLLLCLVLLISCVPLTALAAESELNMTEGDVITGFVPAGTACTTTDASVAWVDDNGNLNALKPGTVTVSDGKTETTVTVADYADGSEVVGNLKLLARFNDSMQFYDGHVYLLFTSYQDGVEISVDDLYAGYEISDRYYDDIHKDIANGSNHTGNNTDDYFTFSKEMKSVTLNRGEIVTIGMYRDFDMSVPQAALGSIKNSSAWKGIETAGKSSVIEAIFKLFDSGKIDTNEIVARLKAAFEEIGVDYNKAIDGVVEGGVCFNRELYNQKLEWDQYENVTYDMDITKNQLEKAVESLGGNLNKFSILKNSCATVALGAWNAAVGTRDGQDTAYKLTSSGDGILSIIDAPKGVRQSMVNRLPGYYLNNAESVAEPGAGYQDDTGWVYVSAPKAVASVEFVYDNKDVVIDETKTDMPALVTAAKDGRSLPYGIDEQKIGVNVLNEKDGDVTTVSGVDFTINGETVSINKDNVPEGGVWFSMPIDYVEDNDYYVTDAEGNVLPSDFNENAVSFCAEALPVSVKVVGSSEGAQNLLRTKIVNGDNADTEIYRMDGENKVVLGATETLAAGTVIYVKPVMKDKTVEDVLADVTLNGVSYIGSANFDEAQGAYVVKMPASYANLTVTYAEGVINALKDDDVQVFVGDTLNVSDYAELTIGGKPSDAITWKIFMNEGNAVSQEGGTLKAEAEGVVIAWACAKDNSVVGVPFFVDVFASRDEVAKITFNDTSSDSYALIARDGETGAETTITQSGTYVKKGAVISLDPTYTDSKALYTLECNGKPVRYGEQIVADKDLEIKATFTKAEITGLPKEIKLDDNKTSYQLGAKVAYSGLRRLFTPYDKSIEYISSNSLVSVDENGLITLNGEIPEDGAAAYVTAYAGSSGHTVSATCRVVVGDYQGDRIVGKLTISARPVAKTELVAHGSVCYTTYEDTDINVSYNNYYKPTQKLIDLSHDYDLHPEKYNSDVMLYSQNELGIDDRYTYFTELHNGPGSPAETLTLQKGESITLSNYGYDSTNLITIRKTFENSTISSSKQAQELVRQINNYNSGENFDGVSAFDSFFGTLGEIIKTSRETGHNPADGHSEGGLDINREAYNQFRRNDSQLPNNYYTVEITADEFARMEQFIANPDNNYYSLMVKNCATGSVDIWNATLFDKPELHLSANLTGIAIDPESLNLQLGAMAYKTGLDGESGKDFYPRIIAPYTGNPDVLGDADGDGSVTIADVTAIQLQIAEMEPESFNSKAADVNGDGKVDVTDATLIQYYVAEMDVEYPIGQTII